ncbi:MAG: hypothetical protein PHQ76_04040 [Caldisericia bacterium]|nr:hypothetical protein [Caldisericia bacterium]
MNKTKLTIIILVVLIIIIGITNGVLFFQKKEPVSSPKVPEISFTPDPLLPVKQSIFVEKSLSYIEMSENFISKFDPYEISAVDRETLSKVRVIGDEEDNLYLQKFPLTNNALVESKEGKDPVSILFPNPPNIAKEICKAREGYHLVTMEEWGILAHGIMGMRESIKGNSRYKSLIEEENCNREDTIFNIGYCLTGTGPSSWCYKGICDLNGNLAEWVDFPDVVDGIVKIQGKEYTLVPANYDMEKALGRDGVENLISKDKDPSPNEKYVSGGSVIIDTNSENFNYPRTIPIKRNTVLGDFDQFRNGDGEKYGDGRYYLWIPTYDRNKNNITNERFDSWFEILVCEDFDGKKFSDCKHYRGCELNTNQINKDQRISSIGPQFIPIKIESGLNCPSEKFFSHYSSLPAIEGYVQEIREEPELQNLAIPASISKKAYSFYSSIFSIFPSGKRYVARGGSWNSIKSGILTLDITYEDDFMFIPYVPLYYGFRCVKDY